MTVEMVTRRTTAVRTTCARPRFGATAAPASGGKPPAAAPPPPATPPPGPAARDASAAALSRRFAVVSSLTKT